MASRSIFSSIIGFFGSLIIFLLCERKLLNCRQDIGANFSRHCLPQLQLETIVDFN